MKSLLIVKLSSLGDVIHTLPAAQALRRALPGVRIGWGVQHQHAAIVERQPWLDDVIVWRRQNARSLLDFVRRLRAGRWETVLDLQGLFRSALVSRLAGARRVIGPANTRELAWLFYNQRVPLHSSEIHAVERSMQLAAALGAHWPGLPIARGYLSGSLQSLGAPTGPELFPLHASAEDWAAVDAWCREHRFDATNQQLVIINPHCRRPANRWPASRFQQLAQRLLDLPGVRVALIGGGVARELCDEIASPLGDRIWRADGKFSLLGSAELLRRAAVCATGDTGPMHLAVAAGTQVVALFGASDPLRTGPYAANAVVLSAGLSCSPCYGRTCRLHYDPPKCLDEISVDRVYAAVVAALDSSADTGLKRTA